MSTEQEIRGIFQDWSEASSRMDLEASMELIADDIVSFEHDLPLRHFGADAIRAICKNGFEQMAAINGAFKWEVDDLQLIAREDIVVAWGINRMQVFKDGRTTYDSRSRGTWVFQRRDDGWKVVHHHLSYPYDAQTGMAVTDLKP